MNESDIVQEGDPVLRETAKAVPEAKITTQPIQKIITRMKAALHDTDDGVAIAAPQIGESVRIFVINSVVFAGRFDVEDADQVFINPEIVNTSKETAELDEGCLSVRNIYGKIERATHATIRALNGTGEKFEMGTSGLLAQIFQHETDHLNGTLFIDKATDLQEISPEERKAAKDNSASTEE